MIPPIWTFGAHGTDHGLSTPTLILRPIIQEPFLDAYKKAISVDFLLDMQGEVQIEFITTNVSVSNGIRIAVMELAGAYFSGHAGPPMYWRVPMTAFTTITKSFYFASGFYTFNLWNVDPVYDVLSTATFNTLRWPRYV